MTFWKLLRSYWYFPLFVILVFVFWFIFRRGGKKTPVKVVKNELEAIKAGTQAREWEERYGAEVARKQVEDTYREELEALDAKKRAHAATLREDPVALSKFLVRAGSD